MKQYFKLGPIMLKRLLLSIAAISIPANGAVQSGPLNQNDREDVHFVNISEIMIPIVDAEAMTGILKVDLVLAATDAAAAARLTIRVPQLRSASVAAALEYSRLYASGLVPVDAERLASDLAAALQPDNPEIERVLVVKVAAAVN